MSDKNNNGPQKPKDLSTSPSNIGSGKEADILLNHNYDGIQEFDNPLPNWWLMTFFGTIIFGVIYWVHYEVGGGPTLKQELAAEMDALKIGSKSGGSAGSAATAGTTGGTAGAVGDAAGSAQQPKGPMSDDELKAAFTEEAKTKGKAQFTSRCAACHGNDGQGTIGPNLTDNFWLNGDGSPKELVRIITKGVPEKGMLAWEAMLKSEEILQAAAYVYSIRGSNPANPKPPQGKEYK